MPTTQHQDEEVEKIYQQIDDILKLIPQRDYVFINGDLNTRVGMLNLTSPDIVGQNTLKDRDSRGDMLVDFCSADKLFNVNTTFKKRRKYTWSHPNPNVTKNKSQIDFIISRWRNCKGFIDADILNTPDISDHHLVCVILKIEFSWYKPHPSIRPSIICSH